MSRPRFSVLCLALLLLSVPSPVVAGDLFVAEASEVQEYNSTTGAFVRTFVPTGSGQLLPQSLVFGPNGNLFVSDNLSDAVLEYNGTTGAFVKTFVPNGSGGLFQPTDLKFGPNGDLFVSDIGTETVLEYNGKTGAFVKTFVPYGSGGLNDPLYLAFGPNGDLLVSSSLTDKVLEYNGKTGAFVKTFASGSGLNFPTGLAFGPNGNLFVGSGSSGHAPDSSIAVLEYNGTTGAFVKTFVPAFSGGLISPYGLAFGPDGDLFVTNPLTGSVLEYNGTTGAFVKSIDTGLLSLPEDVTFGPSVPEPSSLLLTGSGLLGVLGLAAVRRLRGRFRR
jgi:streptogramin lyase